MKKEEIVPGDWQRILLGEAPAEFLLEVFIRTSIIYVALLVVVRLMGKRMSGRLTISELAVMITLGAIVSPAMQIPQLGVLQGIMILACALLFQRGINLLEIKSQKFEEISQGKISTLLENGVMQIGNMEEAKISRQQLFSALRSKSILNLGEVSRVYLEACGMFSVYKSEQPVAGLAIFPPSDQNINGYLQKLSHNKQACTSCGNVADASDLDLICSVCGTSNWMPATISVSGNSNPRHSNS
jgi:uncharacterized membrane protein YcaP (DUF421 family)